MPPPSDDQLPLNRRDQLAVGVLTLIALACIGVWWWLNGGAADRLINIERARPLDYQFLVDVNMAEWPELAQLPQIGETLARRIVARRQAAGPYQTANDLLTVEGIGEKTLDRIRGYLLPMPGEEFMVEQAGRSDVEAIP